MKKLFVAYIGRGKKLHIVINTRTLCGFSKDLFSDGWVGTKKELEKRMLTGCQKCRFKYANMLQFEKFGTAPVNPEAICDCCRKKVSKIYGQPIGKFCEKCWQEDSDDEQEKEKEKEYR